MIKRGIFTVLLFLCIINTFAQKNEENPTKVILITLDGFRWQDLFTGADSLLITNAAYVKNTFGLQQQFWATSPESRRKALMPFLWSEVSKMGQIHGNRTLGSKVNLTNSLWFSYPGYNEILTGKADDKNITSNEKIDNPNTTILELVHQNVNYKGKVAAFGSWDVFPYIINEKRSGVPVNAGFELAEGDNLTSKELFLNQLQPTIPSPWSSVRFDAFTHYYALEYLQKEHPDLVYIAYGETDDFAHDGEYDAYLKSAHATDGFLKELWDFTQNDAFYKDNTLFIVTTDHGRGTLPIDTWKHHGSDTTGAGETWMLLFGKGVKSLGEVKTNEQLYANQIAPTILKVLGLNPDQNREGKPLEFWK